MWFTHLSEQREGGERCTHFDVRFFMVALCLLLSYPIRRSETTWVSDKVSVAPPMDLRCSTFLRSTMERYKRKSLIEEWRDFFSGSRTPFRSRTSTGGSSLIAAGVTDGFAFGVPSGTRRFDASSLWLTVAE